MFNKKLKERLESLEFYRRFSDTELTKMQATAYKQEESIIALKKEATIHIQKLKSNEINIQNLLNLTYELENQLACLLKVVKTSGIVEEAVKGEDIFQFRNTVDALQRYPLYKINKVVTK